MATIPPNIAERYGPEIASKVSIRLAATLAEASPSLLAYAASLPDDLARMELWRLEFDAIVARNRRLSRLDWDEDDEGEGSLPRPRGRPRKASRQKPSPQSTKPTSAAKGGRPRSPEDDLSDTERHRRERWRARAAARYAAKREAAKPPANSTPPPDNPGTS